MAASKYDFNIEQGSSFRLALVYKDANREVVDLTDWCGRIILKTSDNTTLTFVTDNTNLDVYKFYIDGPNGKIVWMLPADTTNDWDFKKAKYDLELESPDDFYTGGGKYVTKLLYGTIEIIKRSSQSSTLLECQP